MLKFPILKHFLLRLTSLGFWAGPPLACEQAISWGAQDLKRDGASLLAGQGCPSLFTIGSILSATHHVTQRSNASKFPDSLTVCQYH